MNRYKGFYIEDPVGNNKFSYGVRNQKRIYVAPLVKGTVEDIKVSREVCFCEVEDGVEVCCNGLGKFIEMSTTDKIVYIFDNHNHAFYFWVKSLKRGLMEKGLQLVHIDQHKDMREPEFYMDEIKEDEAFEYTNNVLNVGNFIKPALKLGIFSDVLIIDSKYGFEEKVKEIDGDFVLDIDIDIFSKDMDYMDFDLRMNTIRRLAKGAKFITIATSPFFIDQEYAIDMVKRIFE